MVDLEIAKNLLKKKDLSLVIVKSGRLVYETKKYGVIGLLEAIEKHGSELAGAAVADKVVGKAAAMLCRYARVAEVYADVISKRGLKALRNGGVRVEHGELVPEILNRGMDELCPFEKLVMDCRSEEECYRRIRERINSREETGSVF
jgi:hypothetical protein